MVNKQLLVLSIGIFFVASPICAMQRKKYALVCAQRNPKKQKQEKQGKQKSLLLQQPHAIFNSIMDYLSQMKPSSFISERVQMKELFRVKPVSKRFAAYNLTQPLQTLLHEALIDNDIALMLRHVNNKEFLKTKDRCGRLPVHYIGSEQAAHIIIPKMKQLNIDVDTQDNNGNTVLHYAYKHNLALGDQQLRLITYLSNKINKKIKNNNGKTAAECMDTGWMVSEISEFYT